MTDPEAVRRMLQECWSMPPGAARIALAEQAVQYADALDDPGLAFDARMTATEAYQRGGERARTFVTFAWCLAEFDRHPDRYQDWYHQLLWYFKYVVTSLTSFPEVPLDRTYAVLDDMQRRYQAGGHSLHAVYQYRWRVAAHIGDGEAADHWYQKWFTAPRDELSDCQGCDPTGKVAHLAARGRDEEAVALAKPVLERVLTCSEQPQSILTELLVPYLRTGRLEEAAEAHRWAYRAHRDHRSDLADIADHLHFCAVTGNQARGLELLERHLRWLDHAPSPSAEMWFAAAGALVLRRLAETGHGDQEVAGAGATVAALREQLSARATGLAARFDDRNGTDHQSSLVDRMLNAEPLVDYLPLSATAARLHARRPPAAPASAAAATQLAADAPFEELVAEVQRRLRQAGPAVAEPLWKELGRRHPVEELTPAQRGRWEEVHGLLLFHHGDFPAAEAAWRRAEAAFATAGDEVRRQLVLGRAGLARCLTDRADTGAELVETATSYLCEHAGAEERATALVGLATLRMIQSRPDAALAALDEAAGYAEAVSDPLLAAGIATRRVHCLFELGHPDRGEAAARAREQCRTVGSPQLCPAALAHGIVLAETGELEAALDAFNEAFGAATEFRGRFDALLGRGQVRSAMGQVDEALPDLVEAVAEATQHGTPADAAFARFELAQAYRQAGRLLDAAETGEEAVARLDRLGAQDAADRCRYLLVTVYQALGEVESALSLLDTLVTNLDGFDHLASRAGMHEVAGDLLYDTDRDAEAAQRYYAAAAGYRTAGEVLDHVRAARKHVSALRWSGQLEEALAALPAAEEAAARLPADAEGAEFEQAKLGYEAAGLLSSVGRDGEALERIDRVADTLRRLEASADAAMAELLHGELLLRCGDAEPAAARLRAALHELPRGTDPARRGAWLLAEALSRLGREAEAATVRDEYGLVE